MHSNAELNEALASAKGRPVMPDFYADWCINCRELERLTYTDPRVANELPRTRMSTVIPRIASF
ncbi:thioredoxin family protein [Burkholderia lata]|uniref:thioredoxin family protein n=1 Tax=Burkholderia lata (strain ATCC 17760 / DSM 23089 / LMG 22485 / NCIMB 9086 / R18194 / 383) TaxID=482957 RepID=UPI003F68A872